MTDEELANHIRYLDSGPRPTGWFFYDETEDEHGPFETQEEALESLKAYCKTLEGDFE